MSELSKQARELLRAGKTGLEPGPGAADRVRQNLDDALAAGEGAASAGGASASITGSKAVLLVVGVSAGIALAYLAVTSSRDARVAPSATEAAIAVAPARDAGASDSDERLAPVQTFGPPGADAPSGGEHIDAGPARAAHRNSQRVRAASSSPPRPEPDPPEELADAGSPQNEPAATSLMAELRFIEAARSHLATGNADRALGVLSRHEAEFPAGQLGQEAAELRVRALCRAGRDTEAEAEAARLVERWPMSPFAARAGSICGG